MGSGKSTLGKKTAPLFELSFIDLDDFIEEQEGKTISQLFQSLGESGFRKKEAHYLSQLILSEEKKFIALGGGTVCFENNLEVIKSNGRLIYLHLPESALAKRLVNSKKDRPLLANLNEDEILVFIQILMAERKPFYEQAHKTVNGIDLNAQQLFTEICALL